MNWDHDDKMFKCKTHINAKPIHGAFLVVNLTMLL